MKKRGLTKIKPETKKEIEEYDNFCKYGVILDDDDKIDKKMKTKNTEKVNQGELF